MPQNKIITSEIPLMSTLPISLKVTCGNLVHPKMQDEETGVTAKLLTIMKSINLDIFVNSYFGISYSVL